MSIEILAPIANHYGEKKNVDCLRWSTKYVFWWLCDSI